ncbi:TIGR02281 family clan AA aspartic protease [Chitinimonas sp. BJYL2]|uniref:retropepsin-like aspartic protease family protein n=1 Tax=Chitinimonas sp. BJYL2 TaxID=2976696 RepID=UPI0022B4CCEA|nr:TIGR02281 family clan AA aspartic protease [Chitinimonas sp. BJYL2]
MRTLLALLMSLPLFAAEPVLLATMGNKASVSFGDKPVTMVVGSSREGVKLISVSADAAVFEILGKRKTVALGQSFFAPGGGEGGSVREAVLYDAGGGHFIAQVSINGGGVRGLIDTGATFLSLSSVHAASLGIKPDRRQPVTLSTAQGVRQAWRMKVDLVRIEGIPLYNVDAVITDGNFPAVALVGMSVLSQLHVQHEGDRMKLRKKY